MTVYANLVDGEVKGVYDLLPKHWNGINNFDIAANVDENIMLENGFVKIVRCNPDYDKETQKLSDFPTYTVENGQVIEHREILPIPIPTREDLLVGIRMHRDELMSDFSWRYERYYRQQRMGLSTTDSIEALDAYMQALADITLQEDLNNIVWPTYNEQ